MRSLVIVSGVVSCLAFATVAPREARADAPKPAAYFTPGMVGAFTTEGKGLPPVALQTVLVTVPVSERWSLIGKVGYATPFTAFQPAPHLQLGAAVRLADAFRLGATGLYRYVPHWSGTTNDANLVGGALVPIIPVAGTKLLLQLPVGAAYNTRAETWSISTGVELALPLPF